MNNTTHINKEETSLPKPMLALVIAALITSPTFLAGCSSTQHKSDTLANSISNSTPKPEHQASAESKPNETSIVSIEEPIAENPIEESSSTLIEKENEIISEIQSPQEQRDKTVTDSVLLEIDQAIEEIATTQFERPARTIFKFGFDRKQLSDEEINIISEHGLYLSQNPKKKIQIHGHADAQGAPLYNQYLAKQRAEHVANVLKQAGVADHQIDIVSWGSEKPAPSATHWKDNRRVEIIYDEAFVVQKMPEENNIN